MPMPLVTTSAIMTQALFVPLISSPESVALRYVFFSEKLAPKVRAITWDNVDSVGNVRHMRNTCDVYNICDVCNVGVFSEKVDPIVSVPRRTIVPALRHRAASPLAGLSRVKCVTPVTYINSVTDVGSRSCASHVDATVNGLAVHLAIEVPAHPIAPRHQVDGLKAAAAPIRSVGIVGAGLMGGGIAMSCAAAAIPTVLIDATEASLARGLKLIDSNYKRSVERGSKTQARDTARWHCQMVLPGGIA